MNVLVPLSTSRTIDSTVKDAVDRVLAMDGDDGQQAPTVHLVYIETPGRERSETRTMRSLADRTTEAVQDRAGEAVSLRTSRLAGDRYLATPHDHAAVLVEYVRGHDIDLIVLDPSYSVDATDSRLQPIEDAFDRAELRYEYADVDATRRVSAAELRRFTATFVLAFGFSLAVGSVLEGFGLATGLLAGLLAGVLFRNVTFETTPSFRRIVAVLARGVLFVPYLLWKILKANVQISYLVLHPALPIDPHLDRFDTALADGLSITGMANSLTLTPGTLTVDAERSELLVHSVTPGARLEMLSGERERAIRFVFYGPEAADVPRPLDRDGVETLSGPTDVSTIETEADRTDTAEQSAGSDTDG